MMMMISPINTMLALSSHSYSSGSEFCSQIFLIWNLRRRQWLLTPSRNSLHSKLRQCDTLGELKRWLKTHLFGDRGRASWPPLRNHLTYLLAYLLLQVYDAFIYYPVSNVFSCSSVWIIVLLTVERYISVRFPLKAKELCTRRLARRTIVVVVVWALAINIPRFLCSTVVQSGDEVDLVNGTRTSENGHGTSGQCVRDLAEKQCQARCGHGASGQGGYKRVSTEFESSVFYRGWTWMIIVVVHMIPCVTLLFLNASLIAIVYRASRRRAELHAAVDRLPSTSQPPSSTSGTPSHSYIYHSAEQIRMTVTCISIICLFLICIVPSAFSNRPIAKALFGRGQTMNEFIREPLFRLLRVATNLLVYCNLSLNFVLYCVFNQKFLRVLKMTLQRCVPAMLRSERGQQCYALALPGTTTIAAVTCRAVGAGYDSNRGSNRTSAGSSAAAATTNQAIRCADVAPPAQKCHLLVGYRGSGRNGEAGDENSGSSSMMPRHLDASVTGQVLSTLRHHQDV